ncbi:molybdenum cofactor guanylyltransferase [Paenibacillus sp. HB172176]|uniref:molybdenum cofactor guanylyltransferase n=1 Tax=Paenibacillus sp. HB172176 TaxID=2493690 RepID=UPI0014399737|nr:molybdenum cofactor guanylyltransferase [Paenibacillus sp. HB172176]
MMLTGLILAGGPDARLRGQTSALLPFGDSPLIVRQVWEMKKICQEVIVATPDPTRFLKVLDSNTRIITDYYSGMGPMGGMFAGFSLARYKEVWAIGSEMPFVSAKAALLLRGCKLKGFEAALPLIGGGVYPLHGIYDKSCAQHVQKLLEQGERSASSLLRSIVWKDMPDASFLECGIALDFVNGFHTWEEYESMNKQFNIIPPKGMINEPHMQE